MENTISKKILLFQKFNPIQNLIINPLRAVDPEHLIRNLINRIGDELHINGSQFQLNHFHHIHLIAAGKASIPLARGLKSILKQQLGGGLIVSAQPSALIDASIHQLTAGHPIPDSSSREAADKMIKYIRNRVKPNDLVISLISGGASALLSSPLPGLTLDDLIQTNRLLLKSRADILEINCIRKHLSAVKGGRLGRLIHPATNIQLILSDIIRSPKSAIGSGPFLGDPTTYRDAAQIVEKFDLSNKLPERVISHLRSGIAGGVAESPFPDDPVFSKTFTYLLADNLTLLDQIKKTAGRLGIRGEIIDSCEEGDTKKAADNYASLLRNNLSKKSQTPATLFIAGGEFTLEVRGSGKGGRNQQFMLELLHSLPPATNPFWAASFDSDGIDGPTEAAGAWIDEHTFSRVKKNHLDIDRFMENNDSYHFFKTIDQLIKTGPTANNLMDIRLVLIP